MLDRVYNKATIAVLSTDFKEYLSQFDIDEGVPEILNIAEIGSFSYNGVQLTILSWVAEDEDAHATFGVEGDKELLMWFKPKPRRVVLVGGDFDFYECTENVAEGLESVAFRSCFKRVSEIRLNNDVTVTGTVADHLRLIRLFDMEKDM